MINDLPVIVGVSTIKERMDCLVDMLESIGPQVEEIHVYLGDYDTPERLMLAVDQVPGIGNKVSAHCVHGTNIGDTGKFRCFFGRPYEDAYYLTCDDDIIYPDDYVARMIEGIERYDREAVCSFHGRTYYGPVESYYRTFNDRIQRRDRHTRNYACLSKTDQDFAATLIGTVCAGWHSSRLDLSIDDFAHPNMTDIWLSKKCNDAGIARMVLAHDRSWIRHTDKIDTKRDTICARHFHDDQVQTGVFN